uniref:Uncharacterized protein n=1 Tax=Arundo donax TaxID=35708 RepID=A0A0A9I3P8_ARUDO
MPDYPTAEVQGKQILCS